VSVLALLAIIALPDLRTFLDLALVIGLTVLSTAAARAALGNDLAPAPGGHRVGRARHGVLLMNPLSGNGKVARFELVDRAGRQGVTAVVLKPGDDLRALAEEAVADGADVLGMAGGDGSQALVADVARRHGIAFVCVPAGTRNHFALDLGLDREDVAAALDAFGPATERRVDLARLGERVFVNNVSLGLYATVVQTEGYREAKVTTVTQRLPELLGPDAEPFDLRYTGPDGLRGPDPHVVLVSNGVYHLDSLTGFGTRAWLDGGVLGVVAVTVDRAMDVPALVSAELAGQPSRFRGYRSWTVREFEVDSGQELIDVGVDGEALRLRPPLRFRALPGALRVRVPIDAPGAAPAAKAPRGLWKAVTALLAVLAGRPAR
jgi:diacylglycerol kinase family enzyme